MNDKKKTILLRISPELADSLNRLARDELRSVNAQIEYILREAVRKRTGKEPPESPITPEEGNLFLPHTVQLKNQVQAVIRQLTLQDGEALADFYESIPPEDFRFYCPHPLTRTKAKEMAAAALAPRQVVLVLEAPDHTIGGYAWFRWQEENASKSGFGMCLRRDFQGTGAARAIITPLLQIAREVGPPVMSLTVQKANVRGVELYKKMGFGIVREQVRPAKPEFGLEAEPEYYMELKLR
jgi:RimJ/RimL family protein N-acetyltransferase